MFRIDVATASASLPTPAAPGPKPNGYFISGTTVTADFLNSIQEEICYVVEQSGGTLSKTDRTQLYTAFQALITAFGGLTAIVQDTDPHLGGDLNTNNHKITSATGIDIQFTPGSTGNVILNGVVVIDNALQWSSDPTNTLIFGAFGLVYQLSGTDVFYVGSGGFGLNGAGTACTLISDDVTLAGNSPTTLPTQHAVKTYVDNAPTYSFQASMLFNLWTDSTLTAGNTYYFTQGKPTSTAPGAANAYTYLIPYMSTDFEMTDIYFSNAPGSGQSYTVTLYKNGSPTVYTATCSGTNTSASLSSLGPISVAANDYLTLQVVLSASAASLTYVSGYAKYLGN